MFLIIVKFWLIELLIAGNIEFIVPKVITFLLYFTNIWTLFYILNEITEWIREAVGYKNDGHENEVKLGENYGRKGNRKQNCRIKVVENVSEMHLSLE